jgi:hypothetical protein
LKDNTEKIIEDDISTEDSEGWKKLRFKEKVHFSQNHPFNKVLYKNVIKLFI